MLNVTVSANTISSDVQGLYFVADGTTATAIINNTIMGASQQVSLDLDVDQINGGSATLSGGTNFVRTTHLTNGIINNFSAFVSDPKLNSLASNGGPTQTMSLQASSAAIDFGNNTPVNSAGLTTDQRGTGFARIFNGTVDIGAFEVQPTTASPTLSTTPSASTVTLGSTAVTLRDTAVLTGGSITTGSITFTLYNPSGSLVDTETVSVSSLATYTTPTGYSLPTTGSLAGTYQWDASYSGDSNNNSVSDNNATNEQVRVNAASPTLSATPNLTSFALPLSPSLSDSAVLLNGYHQTGTLTFTLLNPSGSVVLTETVSVTGNGQYTTPSAYTLPTTDTITGTYQWDASYSGDGNNNSVSENNATTEQVRVNAAIPTLSTTPSATSVTLPSATPLRDTATLSGGYHETGSITFALYSPSNSLLDMETVSVTGNCAYTTPTGYTFPTAGATAGTYQWNLATQATATTPRTTTLALPMSKSR